ncbi:Protein FAR1-RELATED SEQUENCE 5 [Linum perenne]
MRKDFKYFGDSISFDTTYRTNNTARPLAIFVGKNNHHQLIVFGAALLYDETIPTFEWLFNTFSRCMDNEKPSCIFTDQCAAIKAAVRSVFPNTFHGLCTFHLLQNAHKNLGTLATPKFRDCLRYIMYNIETEAEFEHEWKNMIATHFPGKGPNGHKWLDTLYTIRQKWCCVWLRNQFCLGMKSSQLSESLNSNLRRYVNSKMTLSRFFEQFDRMIENKRETELQADYTMGQAKLDNRYHKNSLARHAATVYTPEIFNFFQDEYSEAFGYTMDEVESQQDEGIKKYIVYKFEMNEDKLDERQLIVSEKDFIFQCSCRTYEYCGWICRHIIRAFDYMFLTTKNIRYLTLPETYIKKRWTKYAKIGFQFSFSTPTNTNTESVYTVRFQALSAMTLKFITIASSNETIYEHVFNSTKELLLEAEKEPESTSAAVTGMYTNFCTHSIKISTCFNFLCTHIHSQNVGTSTNQQPAVTGFENVKGLKKRTDKFGKSNKRAKPAWELAIHKTRQNKVKKMKEDKRLELTIATLTP